MLPPMALPSDPQLLRAIKSLIARKTPSSSSIRGRPERTAQVAQRFLRSLRLTGFGTSDAAEYRRRLDAATLALESELPGRNTWGLARKLLNMFLRDCCYNAYLRAAYHLGRAERFMEVPLDSLTIEKIGDRARLRKVQLRNLTAKISDDYQGAAGEWAKQRGLRRVHLDAVVFGARAKRN